MNICIVSPSFGYGGSNIVAARIGKELSRENNLTYFSYEYKDNYSDLPEKDLFFFEGKKNIMIKKTKKAIEFLLKKGTFTPSRYYFEESQALFNLLENKNIECVILNSFIAVTIFAKLIKARYPEIRLIGWMHESTEHSFKILAKNYLISFVEAIKTVDAVVCLSQEDLAVFKKYNKNSLVIYNPVLFETEKKANLNSKIISFTSRLDVKIKGLDLLIELAKKIPNDWKIRVAANGKPEQIKTFKRMIDENQVNEQIDFVGALKGEELINHYLSSSIFLSTSRMESFQMVLVEAMECGLPVISFKHSGAKEIFKNGKFGILVENFNLESMSEEILSLINSKQRRIDLKYLSLYRVNDFHLEKIIQEWKELIQKIGCGL